MATEIIYNEEVVGTSSNSEKQSNVIGYGLGSLGKDLALGVIGSYLLLFYTNVLGISAAIAGIIMVTTKIWDAVNDPMMGSIVDRTNSRFGRFRPYLLLIPLPLAIFSALTFYAPDISYTGKVVYAFVTYTITGMLFTAYDVPLMGMVPVISKSRAESGKFVAASRFFTSIAILLATSIAYPIIEALGGGSEVENLKVGYPLFMLIVGVVSVVFGLVAFVSTKEQPIIEEKKKEKNVFKEFASVLKHKQILVLFVTMIFQALALIVPNTAGAYYMIYVMHKPEMIPVYFLVTGAAGIFGAPVASVLIKKASPKKITQIVMAISAVLSVLAFFIPTTNMTLLFLIYGIYGFTVVIPMVTISVMMVQTADYLSQIRGKRSDGTIFSLNSFAIKAGTALAGGVVSWVLATTHFNPAEFMQEASVISGITSLRTFVLAGFYVIAIIVVSRFSIDNSQGDQA